MLNGYLGKNIHFIYGIIISLNSDSFYNCTGVGVSPQHILTYVDTSITGKVNDPSQVQIIKTGDDPYEPEKLIWSPELNGKGSMVLLLTNHKIKYVKQIGSEAWINCKFFGFGATNVKYDHKEIRGTEIIVGKCARHENFCIVFSGNIAKPCQGDTGGPLLCNKNLIGILQPVDESSCSDQDDINVIFENLNGTSTYWIATYLSSGCILQPSFFLVISFFLQTI